MTIMNNILKNLVSSGNRKRFRGSEGALVTGMDGFCGNFVLILLIFLGFSSAGPGTVVSERSGNSLRSRGIESNNFLPYGRQSYSSGNSVREARQQRSSNSYLHLNLSFVNEIEKKCSQFCSEQPQYINNHSCVDKGCKNWQTGLREGCSSVCEQEKDFRDLRGCKLGCKNAIEDYFSKMKKLLGTPDPPTLVSSSLNSTSLQLNWDGSSPELPYLAFIIQRRACHRSHQQWEMIPTQPQPLNQTVFTVRDLRPYTDYQFRVGWVLAHDLSPLYSKESSSYKTLPEGKPNAPQITSIQAISNTSVSVTWVPPSQPNGYLLAYTLQLVPLSSGNATASIKEIPMIHDPRGYTFSGLSPNTNYSLSLSARNQEGEGEAATIEFSTPQTSASPDTSEGPEPKLLLQGGRDVFFQDLDFDKEPDVILFASRQNITAIAAHLKYKWVFIATGGSNITRQRFDGSNTTSFSCRGGLDITISFLSVDWLHDKLFIVGRANRGRWIIRSSDLDGQNLEDVYTETGSQPVDFAANPFTGYLYWVANRHFDRVPGLYKLNMSSKWPADTLLMRPTAVLVRAAEDNALGPFTMDYINYRILIVDRRKNTILSLNLAGDATDIRNNTQSPQFGDVLSLAVYKGIFYWTTGSNIVLEEYNSRVQSFFHVYNEISSKHQPCNRLMLLHPDSQPTPVPLAPPTNPQAIFGTHEALISWRPPAVIAGLGKDAWTQWKYQVRLSDNTTVMNINSTQVTLMNLEANTTYAVQILPYSASGRGPLSIPFRGKTLPEVGKNITILWAARNGLYATDPMGENVKPLQSASIWMSADGPVIRTGAWFPTNRLHLAATAWCNEFTTYLLLSNGTVYQDGGRGSGRPLLMQGIVNAQSIAYDYIGEKLYWSDPKKQTILRTSLSQCREYGHDAEWLQIDTIAKEIAIDSSRAVLVWSTGHSLETSRLNGLQPFTLYQAGLFSGVHITGITLDTERSRLFFVTRSSQGSRVYKMDYTLHPPRTPDVVVVLEDISILGPIRYFHDRLLWLQDSSVSILMDLQTKSRTTLELRSIENVTSFQIRDLSTWKYPAGHTKSSIKVFPASVLNYTVKIEGLWNNFTISWKPINNINQGTISYSLVVSMKHMSISRLIESPSMMISTDKFPPFSDVEVKIVAMSYWASSRPTVVRLTTPAGTPSAPLNPRVFVERVTPFYRKVYYHEQVWNLTQPLINAEVRWDPPKNPNGHILGYFVACEKQCQRRSDCMSLCFGKNVSTMNCVIRNLSPNTTYHFKIRAYTKAGQGDVSQAVTLNTSLGENPVPRMLVTSGTKLEILDLDRNSLQKVFDGVPNPVSAVYFALENTVYWLNDGQDLMKTRMNEFNSSRVLSLHPQGVASNLAIDWIGRKLFWASEHNSTYSIYSLDLSAIEDVREPAPRVILTSHTAITGLSVNPFKGEILWTASRNKGRNSAFVATTNGTSVKPFLSRDSINCNCSRFSSVGEPITFDPSGYGRMQRGILFLSDNIIYMADENGCYCVKIVNVTSHVLHRSTNQPFKIAADHHRVYWSGGYVSATEKYEHSGVTELVSSGIYDISVLTPQSQPLPELDCLIPSQLLPEAPTLAQHSSHSLHIMLPNISLSNCPYKDISVPAPKYKVFYGKVNENGISECTPSNVPSCHVISTSKSYLVITDLSPFTTYTVFVNVTNVYAELEGLVPLACPAIMLQTAPGAPMPPKLLRIERLTPSSIRVVWRKPLKLNGEKVWYKVHWQPEKRKVSPGLGWKEVEVSPGDDWSEIKSKSNENRTEFHLTVSDLMPGSKYSVWVVAFSEKGDAWSKSENKSVITYPNPRNLTLAHAAPYSLSLSWLPSEDSAIIRYQFVYRMGWHTDWNSTEIFSISSQRSPHKFLISNLKPKTAYGFRIRAWYAGDPETVYEWPRDMYQPGQFLFETQADKPGSPGIPRPRGIGKSLYEVAWERADPNGAEVEFYSLECRIAGKENMNDLEDIVELPQASQNDSHKNRVRRNSGDPVGAQKLVQHDHSNRSRYRTSDWFVVYNGSEPRWEVKGIELNANVSFRVRALNKYGWGDYSNESSSESMESLRSVAEPQHFNIIFGSIVTAVLIVTVFGLSFLFMYRQKLKEKPGLRSPSSAERREVELATLRELPTGSGFVHQNNILYAANELLLDLETAGVPQILRQQIARTKFLGSGAFGEVYEGLVHNLPGSPLDATKVAIKTLRKRAQTNEKIDFIQEAKSMTQFRHPNILQLMGICIDAGPCCLLLELMNGGDLLSYLRDNRPHLGAPVVLKMADLLKMCLDVAKGCVYLEELHFVHRDLAARNCLVRITEIDNGEDSQVSGPPRQERIVKIGDFGLSRDVYRNDYYRKDSAAPVPVRWMAPESLIDGIYTTQSDVWAFGVLVWEIMTLGNQPYPARNNPEVLTYVGGGGRLTPPAHCPPRLTELMLRCWEFFADNRPTFRDCQVELEAILSEIQSSPENSASNFPTIEPSELALQLLNNYLQPGSDSKASYTYRSDDNGEGTEVSTLSRDNTPLYPSSFPKYLEIVKHHPASFLNTMFPSLHEPDVDDGYEKPIPKKPPRNPTSSTLRNRADDPAQAEIGLPPVPYYNTSSSLFVNRFSNSRGVLLAPSNYPPLYSTNNQAPDPVECAPANGKSQMYLNVRKLGLLADADNKDLVAPFRNLLASATSDDGDSSDPELSPGSWRISTSGSLLKNVNKDNQESGRQQVASLSDSGIGSAPDALGCYSQDDEDEDFDGLPLQNFDSVPSGTTQPHASLYPYEHHPPSHHEDENTNHRFLSNSSLHSTNQLSSMRYYSNNGYLYTDNSNGNEHASVDPMTFDRRKPVILSDSISLNFI